MHQYSEEKNPATPQRAHETTGKAASTDTKLTAPMLAKESSEKEEEDGSKTPPHPNKASMAQRRRSLPARTDDVVKELQQATDSDDDEDATAPAAAPAPGKIDSIKMDSLAIPPVMNKLAAPRMSHPASRSQSRNSYSTVGTMATATVLEDVQKLIIQVDELKGARESDSDALSEDVKQKVGELKGQALEHATEKEKHQKALKDYAAAAEASPTLQHKIFKFQRPPLDKDLASVSMQGVDHHDDLHHELLMSGGHDHLSVSQDGTALSPFSKLSHYFSGSGQDESSPTNKNGKAATSPFAELGTYFNKTPVAGTLSNARMSTESASTLIMVEASNFSPRASLVESPHLAVMLTGKVGENDAGQVESELTPSPNPENVEGDAKGEDESGNLDLAPSKQEDVPTNGTAHKESLPKDEKESEERQPNEKVPMDAGEKCRDSLLQPQRPREGTLVSMATATSSHVNYNETCSPPPWDPSEWIPYVSSSTGRVLYFNERAGKGFFGEAKVGVQAPTTSKRSFPIAIEKRKPPRAATRDVGIGNHSHARTSLSLSFSPPGAARVKAKMRSRSVGVSALTLGEMKLTEHQLKLEERIRMRGRKRDSRLFRDSFEEGAATKGVIPAKGSALPSAASDITGKVGSAEGKPVCVDRKSMEGDLDGEDSSDLDASLDQSELMLLRQTSMRRAQSEHETFDGSLGNIRSRLENLQGQSLTLSSKVIEKLREMTGILDAVKRLTTESKTDAVIKDDVEFLLGWNKSNWNFDNEYVHNYRAAAASHYAKCHGLQYKHWAAPRYVSNQAIPPPPKEGRKTLITIHFPALAMKLNLSQTKTSMVVPLAPEKDSAVPPTNDVISLLRELFRKLSRSEKDFQERLGPCENYCLRGLGLNEYLMDFDLIYHSEFVRQNLRRGYGELRQGKSKSIGFVLCLKPEPSESLKQMIRKGRVNLRNYIRKVKPSISPMEKGKFRGLTQRQALKHSSARWRRWPWSWRGQVDLSLHDLHTPVGLKLVGLEGLTGANFPRTELDSSSDATFSVKCFMFYGGQKILFDERTRELPASRNLEWQSSLRSSGREPVLWSNIPRGVRIAFLLVQTKGGKGRKAEPTEKVIGWVVLQLVNALGELRQGPLKLRMWPKMIREKFHLEEKETEFEKTERAHPYRWVMRCTTRENLHHVGAAVLRLELPSFGTKVVAPLVRKLDRTAKISDRVGPPLPKKKLSKGEKQELYQLLHGDILFEGNPEYSDLAWKMRHSLRSRPAMLPKFLQAVPWEHADCMHEAHQCLFRWSPPIHDIDALVLLDFRYPDPVVREYAIDCISRLEDSELRLYLLQLTQALKYENYHSSALSRFLIERSLANPLGIGHYFFWHLKAEIGFSPHHAERYGVILEQYLSMAGPHPSMLRNQLTVVQKLEEISALVVALKRSDLDNKEVRLRYNDALVRLNEDFLLKVGEFQLPLNPKIRVRSLVVKKCKYMSSKMVPLWLVFKNADPLAPNKYVIFKSGDDLRQDILTLQILKIMDNLWLSNGQDMKLNPYDVVATGINSSNEGVGMIQVVLNARTTSDIQASFGGGIGRGALQDDVIFQFLNKENPRLSDKDPGPSWNRAQMNFAHSSAGYCVATYVLGIGDRHNDNIMCTRDGHLFHIDFGHFLGNFKYKFGFKRERTPFAFTTQMAYVMGGPKFLKHPAYKTFLGLTKEAFMVIRERCNQNLLVALFVLMVPARMPELMEEVHIQYLQKKMFSHLSPKDAWKELDQEIKNSRGDWFRRMDNLIHQIKHRK